MSTAKQLLKDVEAFLMESGMAPTTFGLSSVGDGHFVRDLKAGKDVRASTIDVVRMFMADYRPPRPRKGRAGNGVQAAA